MAASLTVTIGPAAARSSGTIGADADPARPQAIQARSDRRAVVFRFRLLFTNEVAHRSSFAGMTPVWWVAGGMQGGLQSSGKAAPFSFGSWDLAHHAAIPNKEPN